MGVLVNQGLVNRCPTAVDSLTLCATLTLTSHCLSRYLCRTFDADTCYVIVPDSHHFNPLGFATALQSCKTILHTTLVLSLLLSLYIFVGQPISSGHGCPISRNWVTHLRDIGQPFEGIALRAREHGGRDVPKFLPILLDNVNLY